MEIRERFLSGHTFLKLNFKKLFPIYLFFVVLSAFEIFTEIFIPKGMETTKIVFQLINFLLIILNTVFYLRILKRDSRPGDFWYLFVPYLLYSIYYSIIGLLGLILLFIPGIIYFFIPIVATFSDSHPPFKTAIKIFKANIKLTIFLSIMSLIIEVFPYFFDYLFKDFIISSVVKFLFDIVATYVLMVLTYMGVSCFYEYVDKAQGVSLEKDLKVPTEI